MMKTPLVTVVIPSYNKAKFIIKAIKSVQNQSLKHWKALIIDDASTDATENIVLPIIKDDRRFNYIKLEKNIGISAVLQYALNKIDTKYFVQLDGDDWLEKDALQLLVHKMETSSENAAVAYGNLVRWQQLKKKKRKKLITHKQLQDKYDFITYHPMFYPRFYKTDAVKAVGGWSTNVPHGGRYSEDRQILLKLIPHFSFLHVNEHLYNHRIHDTNNSGKENLDKYAQVNRYLYEKALKDWGNEYEPVFTWINGRLKVKKLNKKT
ncbi:glycosyl transferase family 2 [Evansella cellulosilytica DSM 2522]|uniref:Glycosyl transferase family 2 n=2 Tax=Evansella TaxID=2837485 RepID=E6TWC5_EVAC2|nr:glycosyl transferase family 2 [Evansella cellulosilytica DSM 2522]